MGNMLLTSGAEAGTCASAPPTQPFRSCSATSWWLGAVGILMVLSVLGINLQPVLAVGGASGIIIGLATQQLLGNAVTGLSLFLSRPFVKGESVTLQQGGVAVGGGGGTGWLAPLLALYGREASIRRPPWYHISWQQVSHALHAKQAPLNRPAAPPPCRRHPAERHRRGGDAHAHPPAHRRRRSAHHPQQGVCCAAQDASCPAAAPQSVLPAQQLDQSFSPSTLSAAVALMHGRGCTVPTVTAYRVCRSVASCLPVLETLPPPAPVLQAVADMFILNRSRWMGKSATDVINSRHPVKMWVKLPHAATDKLPQVQQLFMSRLQSVSLPSTIQARAPTLPLLLGPSQRESAQQWWG